MSKTTYLGLELQESADSTTFEDFIVTQFGKGNDTVQSPLSNLQKIDNFAYNQDLGKANIETLATRYSNQSTYEVDDICSYGANLYRCKVAVTTPRPWSGNLNWEQINIDPLMENLLYSKVVDCGYSGSKTQFFNDLSSLDGLADSLEDLL